MMLLRTADLQNPPGPNEVEDDGVRFSYSRPEQRWRDRLFIRAVEWLSGAPGLERTYREWASARPAGENFFDAAIRLLDVGVEAEGLERVPRSGPVLFVANHPFGVIDGLLLGHLAGRARGDTRIVTHSLLCAVPEAREHLLPVDFGSSQEAQRTTIATRKRAAEWLLAGGSVGIFPAGSVATAQKPFTGRALEGPWHPFAAKLAALRGVSVVPVFFHGANSRPFQIASHINYSLRVSLLFRETLRHRGRTVKVSVGEPIEPERRSNRSELARALRRSTLALGPELDDPDAEFAWPAHIRFD